MNADYEKLMKCYECVQQKISFRPELALILGSGLGDYADTMDVVETLDYHDIEGFPVSTVPGHKGRFVFGYAGGVPIVAMQGRVHFYEGYRPQDVVLPVRLMKLMGAKVLFLTNAAGGINRSFSAGDLMLITDHISMSVPSPLIGENIEELGVRFPDMSEVYSRRLQKIVENAAVTAGVPLRRGVYIQTTGPQYETPAEIRALKLMGANLVGMSTVAEVISAAQHEIRVLCISCVTNMAAGMTGAAITSEEVLDTTKLVHERFDRLVETVVKRM